MAEVAHDTSGPSPKPGDVAPQQASQPDSSDRGKLRVFISYSRDDLDFADQLDAALNACGFECVLDRHGISGGEDWKRRLGNLISEADTVVFVLSPTSARSEICTWEAQEATRLGKRILPVIQRPLEGASPPPQLRERNYIFFHADPKAAPGSGFGTGLAKLIAALNTDFDWLREHTRYLQRATEWDRGGRPANRLLSGDDIAEAKAWAARRPKSAPEPTALHLDFIRASEEEAEARSSAQRKQLEAMAAAQADRQKALHEAEEAQRKRATIARIRNIALVAVSILTLLTGWLYWDAEQQRTSADNILDGATAIILKFKPEMDMDYQKEMFAVFQAGADRGNRISMRILGILYYNGEGVARDYTTARKWWEKAADKGDASAMSNLGSLYLGGQGVAQDSAKALELFKKAADKGEALGMTNLGLLYENGQGVPKDYAKAREWYEKAAARGEPNALARLPISEAAAAGRYADALQLQEALEAKVEAQEIKREGKPGEETAQALHEVAWFALLAGEFTKALTVADRAHTLLPDDLGIESNRAYALMFLRRAEDAKALYLTHKGKPVSGQDGKLWERVIAEDFAEFRKAGLTHPMMVDIERELGVSQ
jgi:TPR repeat protein